MKKNIYQSLKPLATKNKKINVTRKKVKIICQSGFHVNRLRKLTQKEKVNVCLFEVHEFNNV